MSEEQRHTENDQKLSDAYERVLERIKDGAGELSIERLQHELDEAVEFERDVQEFTRDELSLLRVWVERDLREMRGYLAAGGESVANWLGIDFSQVSRRVADALLSIADRSQIEREQLEDDLEASRADYVAGEMAIPGRMSCTHCEAQVALDTLTRIEPCHQCGHRYFVRASLGR
ncbi:zinc ribbon-containing protein [Halomonas halocynthiae]|uniref:zinc ribbon-containing protein n=1 Tax=Halomonas halocynthiae TaxID=176290 RepID=UPI000413B8EE|nr:zinc ribbon-containing protein [Halomonas halocynthiae]